MGAVQLSGEGVVLGQEAQLDLGGVALRHLADDAAGAGRQALAVAVPDAGVLDPDRLAGGDRRSLQAVAGAIGAGRRHGRGRRCR